MYMFSYISVVCLSVPIKLLYFQYQLEKPVNANNIISTRDKSRSIHIVIQTLTNPLLIISSLYPIATFLTNAPIYTPVCTTDWQHIGCGCCHLPGSGSRLSAHERRSARSIIMRLWFCASAFLRWILCFDLIFVPNMYSKNIFSKYLVKVLCNILVMSVLSVSFSRLSRRKDFNEFWFRICCEYKTWGKLCGIKNLCDKPLITRVNPRAKTSLN